MREPQDGFSTAAQISAGGIEDSATTLQNPLPEEIGKIHFPAYIIRKGDSGSPFPQQTPEQIAKNDRHQALTYAIEAAGVGASGKLVVETAKVFEAYLKGDASA